MRDTHFSTLDMDEVASTYEAMKTWFGLRTAQDDARAFTIQFGDTLYPDDFLFIDARDESYDFQGANDTPSVTCLEREEPGAFQERVLRACCGGHFRVTPSSSIQCAKTAAPSSLMCSA